MSKQKYYVVFADVYRNGELLFEQTTVINDIIPADSPEEAVDLAVNTLVGIRDFDYAYPEDINPDGSIILDYHEKDGKRYYEKYNNFTAMEVDCDYTFTLDN